MFDMFAGGALGRMTVFALNIMPYISASIIMQLLTVISPQLEQLKKEGEMVEKNKSICSLWNSFLATVQGYGVTVGIENMSNSQGVQAVMDPGMFLGLQLLSLWYRERFSCLAWRANYPKRNRKWHFANNLHRNCCTTSCRTKYNI